MPLIAASAAYQKTEERRRDKEQRKGRKGDEGKRKGFLAALRSRWRIQEKKKDSGFSAAEIIMKEMIIINTDQKEKEKDTMKRHVITTFMKKHLMKTTALCAAAVIAAASSGMTANASGPLYTEGDGWFSGAGQDEVAAMNAEQYANNSWETVTYTWDVEDSAPADTSADAGASSASNESYDNVSYDNGSEVSYDSGSSNESYDEAGSDYTDNSTMNSNTAASTQAATGTSGVERKGNTVTVPGKETFRQKSSSANGTYTVIHMGQEKYTLQLRDAAGNNVGFKGVGMYKADDGKYFINVVPNDGADTTGWSVVTMKGDKAYLPKLGISGVALDGTVIVDVDAEAAAQ